MPGLAIADEEQILALVRQAIDQGRLGELQIEIVPEGVRRNGEWWYIPIRIDGEGPGQYADYARLCDFEEELEAQGLKILLVPSS